MKSTKMSLLILCVVCLILGGKLNAGSQDITYPSDVSDKKNLVVSLSGAGVYFELMKLKGINVTNIAVRTLLNQTVLNASFSYSVDEETEAKKEDQITEIAGDFVDDNTMSMTGYPWLFGGDPDVDFDFDVSCETATYTVCVDDIFELTIGPIGIPITIGEICYPVEVPVPQTCRIDLTVDLINDSWWGPKPAGFASEIQNYLTQMADNPKLILIGKSLGGCLLYKTAKQLDELGIDVDLMILVDASCNRKYHSNETISISSNVKNLINLRQDNRIDGQNGYQVSYQNKGRDVVVNKYDSYVNKTLCSSSVEHMTIDECQGVLDLVATLVRAELNGDIMTAINLLLLD